MSSVLNIGILSVYLLSLYILGTMILRRWSSKLPVLFSFVASALAGVGAGVPVTYVSACVFAWTEYPILYAVSVVSVLVISSWLLVVRGRNKEQRAKNKEQSKNNEQRTNNKQLISDACMVVFSLAISTWLMTKTFHGGPAGELFVGSNNVFDFGNSLGIVRSFSWGSNIPIMSPFESGAPFFYHFYFYFFVAIWEYFGVPIVWAMNIPSIFAFAALLMVVYYFPRIIAKQRPAVGWIAVLLTVTNSSLAFWQLVISKGLSGGFLKYLWQLPAYPFAGPFDGSTISLFVTLNNYVNQRHLAFSIALGLFMYLFIHGELYEKTARLSDIIVAGVLTGSLFLWNVAVYPVVLCMVSILFVLHKRWKLLLVFLSTIIGVTIVVNAPNLQHMVTIAAYLLKRVPVSSAGSSFLPTWNIFDYLWQNLGLLPLAAMLGYMVLSKKLRVSFFLFLLLFVIECAAAGVGKRGFDQKFYSFLITGINILAGIGIFWLWRRRLSGKVLAVMLFGVLTISGVVDLMPVKNEFAFPIVSQKLLPVVTWIHTQTPKDAVFVSYADMIDPVVFAGRRNYFGFFGNIVWIVRTDPVARIFSGDMTLAREEGIDYILIPLSEKSGFPYHVDRDALRSQSPTVYEDEEIVILKVNEHR